MSSLDQIEEEVMVSALEECLDNAGVNRCFVIFKRSDTHTAAKIGFESDIAARYCVFIWRVLYLLILVIFYILQNTFWLFYIVQPCSHLRSSSPNCSSGVCTLLEFVFCSDASDIHCVCIICFVGNIVFDDMFSWYAMIFGGWVRIQLKLCSVHCAPDGLNFKS